MDQPLQKLPPVIAIVGPTGSGKSDMAIKIARKINGELISADSRQIYRGLNIATAKLKPPRGIKQWLIDVVPPDQPFTLFDYQRLAWRIIDDIHRRKKIPIMVGGTGLYIDAVLQNWQLPKDSFKAKLRKNIAKDL